MVHGFSKTPRYVLKDGSRPTSPAISQAPSKEESTVIFGFSDKPEYDTFLKASSRLLTPYPLVKGYLQNQIDLNVDSLSLVVLDAASPQQATLYAATFRDVLESWQLDSESVPFSYQLTREPNSQGYRVQAFSSGIPMRSSQEVD